MRARRPERSLPPSTTSVLPRHHRRTKRRRSCKSSQSNLRKQADKVRSLSGTNDVKAAASTIKDALAAASADAKQAVDELRKLDLKGNLGQAFDSAGFCSSL